MVIDGERITVEDFDRFIQLPENIGRRFEYIGGRIFKTPMSIEFIDARARIHMYIHAYVHQHALGFATSVKLGYDGAGFIVSGERYIPDIEFISKKRQPEQLQVRFNPVSPDLVVEIELPVTPDSPIHAELESDTGFNIETQPDISHEYARNLRIKVFNYLAAGTVVWLVHPEAKEIEVYVPGQPVKIIGLNGTLDGGDVLPGFTLAVKDIFPDEKKAD